MIPTKRFVLRNAEIRKRACAVISMTEDEPPMEVVIRPYKAVRSKSQNDYYWAIIGAIVADTGQTKDELHEFLKGRYLVPILERDSDDFRDMMQAVATSGEAGRLKKLVATLVSTTQLNTKQFSEYIKEVESFAVSNGFYLPAKEQYE